MDASSSTSKKSDLDSLPSDAWKYLDNLPSRGLISSDITSPNPGILQGYVCNHDTAPPEGQLIKTDRSNILIRPLTLKKNKADSKRKRSSEKSLDGRSKRVVTISQSSSTHDTAPPGVPNPVAHDTAPPGVPNPVAHLTAYHYMPVLTLRAMLKHRGLSMKGTKDVLIARLLEADN